MDGEIDVVVCDGFVGNVVLKLTEGVAKTLLGMLQKDPFCRISLPSSAIWASRAVWVS